MTARRIRDRAVLLLLEEGWCQKSSRGPHGERCLAIAVEDAACDLDLEYDDAYGLILDKLRVAVSAETAFGLSTSPVVAWNEDPERTLDDVLGILDALELA